MHEEYVMALERVLCAAVDFVGALLCFMLFLGGSHGESGAALVGSASVAQLSRGARPTRGTSWVFNCSLEEEQDFSEALKLVGCDLAGAVFLLLRDINACR